MKVTAGETQAVHEQTLATIFATKVLDIQGQVRAPRWLTWHRV